MNCVIKTELQLTFVRACCVLAIVARALQALNFTTILCGRAYYYHPILQVRKLRLREVE